MYENPKPFEDIAQNAFPVQDGVGAPPGPSSLRRRARPASMEALVVPLKQTACTNTTPSGDSGETRRIDHDARDGLFVRHAGYGVPSARPETCPPPPHPATERPGRRRHGKVTRPDETAFVGPPCFGIEFLISVVDVDRREVVDIVAGRGAGEPIRRRTLPELTCAVAFERHRSSSAASPSRPASTRRGDAPKPHAAASGRKHDALDRGRGC